MPEKHCVLHQKKKKCQNGYPKELNATIKFPQMGIFV